MNPKNPEADPSRDPAEELDPNTDPTEELDPNTDSPEAADNLAERLNAAYLELSDFVEAAGERGRCLQLIAFQRGSSALLTSLAALRERIEAAEEALRRELAA